MKKPAPTWRPPRGMTVARPKPPQPAERKAQAQAPEAREGIEINVINMESLGPDMASLTRRTVQLEAPDWRGPIESEATST